jgi:sugar phosphate isomerase/epimerase
MQLAIQTLLLPGRDLVEKFDCAAQCGFDGVEIAVGPNFDLMNQMPVLRQAMASSGLAVADICTHPMHDPVVPDAKERQLRLAKLTELVQLADELGATGVVSVPVRPPHLFAEFVGREDREELLTAYAADVLREWATTLPAGRAALFLEPLNRYETYFLNRVEQAITLAQAINHPRVQVLADFFHMNIEESGWSVPIAKAGTLLGMVHVADNNRLQPGRGCLNFQPGFAALKQIGYRSFVSIECWSPQGPLIDGDPATALPETVRFLRTAWNAA